jgi:selenocysteine lyase/cysteine desulfurase
MNYTAALALGIAIEQINTIGVDLIRSHGQALTEHLLEGLSARGAEVLTPRAPENRGSAVTARFPGRDGGQVAHQLNAAGVIVSPRVGTTRFAPHIYNDTADVERALSVLDGVLDDAAAASSESRA